MVDRVLELLYIERVQRTDQPIVLRFSWPSHENAAKHWRNSHRQQERAPQGKSVRVSHRSKNLSLRTAHREQRQQGANHNERREEQGPLYFTGSVQNARGKR